MKQKIKVGCCGRAKILEEENQKLKTQFEIAWRTLHYYKMEANALRANDAVARILAIGPVSSPAQDLDVTKVQL